MRRLIIQRLLALVPILFGITFLSFALMHLAGGDAVLARVDASGVQLSAEALAAERARLGLDKPFLVQYLIWLEGFLTRSPVFMETGWIVLAHRRRSLQTATYRSSMV